MGWKMKMKMGQKKNEKRPVCAPDFLAGQHPYGNRNRFDLEIAYAGSKRTFPFFKPKLPPVRRLNQKRKRKQILNSAENPLIFIFISDLPVLRGKFCV